MERRRLSQSPNVDLLLYLQAMNERLASVILDLSLWIYRVRLDNYRLIGGSITLTAASVFLPIAHSI